MAPRDEYELLDNWYTTGLRGTGSIDYRANDLFVPEERTFSFLDGAKDMASGQPRIIPRTSSMIGPPRMPSRWPTAMKLSPCHVSDQNVRARIPYSAP